MAREDVSLLDSIEYRPVDETTWDDLVRLFEGRGGPKYCWCLAWRESYKVREGLELPSKRAIMERRVQSGETVGLLAYLDGEPVGWCSVSPRETYVALGGEQYPDARVWSIVCFFVLRRVRKQGMSAGLLRAAVDLAASRGAEVIEAYPVDPDSPSYRFMGQRAMFLEAGFEETGMAGSRRHVMRLRLTGAADI